MAHRNKELAGGGIFLHRLRATGSVANVALAARVAKEVSRDRHFRSPVLGRSGRFVIRNIEPRKEK